MTDAAASIESNKNMSIVQEPQETDYGRARILTLDLVDKNRMRMESIKDQTPIKHGESQESLKSEDFNETEEKEEGELKRVGNEKQMNRRETYK